MDLFKYLLMLPLISFFFKNYLLLHSIYNPFPNFFSSFTIFHKPATPFCLCFHHFNTLLFTLPELWIKSFFLYPEKILVYHDLFTLSCFFVLFCFSATLSSASKLLRFFLRLLSHMIKLSPAKYNYLLYNFLLSLSCDVMFYFSCYALFTASILYLFKKGIHILVIMLP